MATKNYVQSNTLYQAGSGNIVGDITITLTSLQDIYGNTLTMSDFGDKGYCTAEPQTNNEDAFIFTGITANTNGTFTLTGVTSILAKSPYTEQAGMTRQHAGGTAVIITDNVAFWNSFANKDNDETITGDWIAPNQLVAGSSLVATEDDIAAAVIGASGTATNTTFGTVKLSVAAVSVPNPIAVGDNDPRIPTQNENDALAGSSGSPSSTNKYLTENATSNGAVKTATTIAFVNSNPDTITDSGNGFVTAGFKEGQTITVSGSASNNGTFTISSVAAGTITLISTDSLTNESAGASVTITVATINKILNLDSSGAIPSTIIASSNLATAANYQEFLTNGTWTKPAGLTGSEEVIIQIWGGGGGGASSNSNSFNGGGGGGGAFNTATFKANQLTTTVSVTIGAGGAGSPGGSSAAVIGGTTTFGSFLSAFGGGAGTPANSPNAGSGSGGGGIFSAGLASGGGVTGGGPLGSASAADSTFGGGAGGNSSGATAASRSIYGGGGGGLGGSVGAASVYGGGGGGGGLAAGGTSGLGGAGGTGSNNAIGGAGSVPGGGGGGVGRVSTDFAGGKGGDGLCRVWIIR